MTLQEAYNFIESLKNETTNKSEIKAYDKFLHILSKLKIRTFAKDEIQSIETELDRLNLESSPENRKKYYKKALNIFEKYLQDKFTLTTKGYYIDRSIGYGVLFGVVVGILIGERFEKSLGISFGISMGLLISVLVGQHLDSQAKTAGKML